MLSPTACPTVCHRRSIPGFPGYVATSEGLIYGRLGRPLRPHRLDGYERVNVCDEHGRRRHVMVHRLVAVAFLGRRPDGFEVNHQDGIRWNNAVTNLEYVTPSENVRHSIDVLGSQRAAGEANGNAILTVVAVREMRALHREGVTAADVGRRFGIDVSHAWRVCTHRSWRSVA